MLKAQSKYSDGLTIVGLQGQVVKGETEVLRTALQSSQGGVMVFDFARVSVIDAAGLGALLEVRAQAKARGMRFVLMNISKPIRTVLAITRLDSVFEITSTVDYIPPVRPSTAARVWASCA